MKTNTTKKDHKNLQGKRSKIKTSINIEKHSYINSTFMKQSHEEHKTTDKSNQNKTQMAILKLIKNQIKKKKVYLEGHKRL